MFSRALMRPWLVAAAGIKGKSDLLFRVVAPLAWESRGVFRILGWPDSDRQIEPDRHGLYCLWHLAESRFVVGRESPSIALLTMDMWVA